MNLKVSLCPHVCIAGARVWRQRAVRTLSFGRNFARGEDESWHVCMCDRMSHVCMSCRVFRRKLQGLGCTGGWAGWTCTTLLPAGGSRRRLLCLRPRALRLPWNTQVSNKVLSSICGCVCVSVCVYVALQQCGYWCVCLQSAVFGLR